MADPRVAAERWLASTLRNDATLASIVGTRVRSEVVPPDMAYPLVLYTMTSARNRQTANAETIWSELVYIVRVVNRVESFVPLEAGAAAIEAALHRGSGSNVSGLVLTCIYQDPYSDIEIDRDGAQIRSLGGIYRLYVQ